MRTEVSIVYFESIRDLRVWGNMVSKEYVSERKDVGCRMIWDTSKFYHQVSKIASPQKGSFSSSRIRMRNENCE